MKRPNILVIFGDQERHSIDEPECRVVNQRRLAERGVVFDSCFATTAQCSPARASLITGLYPQQHGVVANTSTHSYGKSLRRELWTCGKGLGGAGYNVQYMGKWHISYREGDEDCPIAPYGFPQYNAVNGHHLANAACDWIRAQPQEPWMLWVSFFAPHDIYGYCYQRNEIVPRTGIAPPPNLEDDLSDKPACHRRFRDEDHSAVNFQNMDAEAWRRYLMLYYQFIENVDGHLGRVLDTLTETGALDDTAVVYLSDHGDMAGGHGLPLKGPVMYDELLHIPSILSYPERVPTGVRCDRLTSQVDLVPTLCELTGVEPPEGLPGRNMLDALTSETWRDEIFAEFHSHVEWLLPIRTVRTKEWKYSEYLASGEKELYDLRADPGELINLAGKVEYAATERKMAARLLARRQEIGDVLLESDVDQNAYAEPPRKWAKEGEFLRVV